MYKLVPEYTRASVFLRALSKINRFFRDIRRQSIRREYMRKLPSYTADDSIPYTLHMMLCKRDLEMAVCSAKTFNYFTGQNMRYRFHDDGTLDSRDVETVLAHLPGSKIILRAEADQIAEEKLSNYKAILEYRKNQIMALKLIDVKLWGEGKRFGYIDSDVLFLQKPDFFLDALAGINTKNYFNKDIENSYMQTPDEIESFLQIRPYERINAGLWVMNREDIDLDKIESWLNHPGFKKSLFGYTLDQTFISMLANDSESGVAYLPQTYDVDFYKDVRKSVCKHYVGYIRHGYELEGLSYILQTHFS